MPDRASGHDMKISAKSKSRAQGEIGREKKTGLELSILIIEE
jgi:hypothetical protein